MADQGVHPQLFYASYNNINAWASKAVLPPALQLSERCDRLAASPIPPSYNFNREYELIASYSDILPAKPSASSSSSSSANATSTSTSDHNPATASTGTSSTTPAVTNSSSSSVPAVTTPAAVAAPSTNSVPAVASSSQGIAAVPAPAASGISAVPAVISAVPMPTATVVPPVRSFAEDMKAKEEALTAAMMKETGKERDVCYFFLESVNWDLKQAIDMLKSVDIR